MQNNLKNFIIFGGSGLIGSSIAKYFADKTNHKIIIADISRNKKFNKYKNIEYHKVDVRNEKEIRDFLKKLNKNKIYINGVLIATYPKSKNWPIKFEKLGSNDLKDNLFYQLGVPIIISQQLLPIFKKQNYGNIIFISSIQGLMSPKFDHYVGTNMISPIEYTGAKAGIIAITKYLAKYFKNKNIRINCIAPGGIKDNQNKKFSKKYNSSCLSKGLLDPSDLEGTIDFLFSNSSQFINGQTIIVDDGWTL